MTHLRRIPTQQRSRAKYQLILETAKRLIGDLGNDSVSMREIAKQAELPISSIYQYFPDKNSILEAIMQGYFDEIRIGLKHFVDCCQSREEMKRGIVQGIDQFYATFKKEPALAILWAGLQANPQLRELDVKDSQENAELLTNKLCCFSEPAISNQIYNAVLLLLHTAGMTVRLALDMEEEQANAFIEEYKVLALSRLDALTH